MRHRLQQVPCETQFRKHPPIAALTRLLQVPATDLKIAADLIDTTPDLPQARAIVRAAREIADVIAGLTARRAELEEVA